MMKKSLFALLMSAALIAPMGCSNWNRMTPAPLDNTTMEAEIRKNLTADSITGLGVEIHEGVVTLSGHLANAADRQKAIDDARKVPGVKSVVNRIDVP
jgi:osmotically-inducible protein OsmY